VTGEPDLIVIGGGSAGAACAARLAEGGRRVLLVVAGKSDRVLKSKVPALMSGIVHTPEFDWMYKAEPDESVGGRPDVWPAAKRLGGGSAINGMMFIRGHKWDYDHWAELGATGWDYASVLPCFRRMENNERGEDSWRGRGGPIAVSEVRSRYAVTDEWIEAVQGQIFLKLNGR
jgi:choline dehydrogenase